MHEQVLKRRRNSIIRIPGQKFHLSAEVRGFLLLDLILYNLKISLHLSLSKEQLTGHRYYERRDVSKIVRNSIK